MKKIFLIIFLGILILSPLLSSAAGLVPCGGQREPVCQFCHFFVLFKNIVDFFLLKIVPPMAVLMLAIAGIMYIFAHIGSGEIGGKSGPALLSQANKLLMSVVWGLLIIFGAWIFVNTFFMAIGVADWTGLKAGWWKIDCPINNCTPNCSGKQCGSDGCGGSCGTCQPEYTCNSNGQCVPQSQNCADMRGACKSNACNTYTDCTSLSGTCSSGYCCSGSCGPAPISCPVNSDPDPVFRSCANCESPSQWKNIYSGQEITYISKIAVENTTYLYFSIAGSINANVDCSLEFPDGRLFTSQIVGDSGSCNIRIASQSYTTGGEISLRPNISDQYLPKGYYTLKIKQAATQPDATFKMGTVSNGLSSIDIYKPSGTAIPACNLH